MLIVNHNLNFLFLSSWYSVRRSKSLTRRWQLEWRSQYSGSTWRLRRHLAQDEAVHTPAMVHWHHGCCGLDHTLDSGVAALQAKTE